MCSECILVCILCTNSSRSKKQFKIQTQNYLASFKHLFALNFVAHTTLHIPLILSSLNCEHTSERSRSGQPLSLASVKYWLKTKSTSDEHVYNSYLLGARAGATDRALFERATWFSCASLHETFIHSCLSCTCWRVHVLIEPCSASVKAKATITHSLVSCFPSAQCF